jgi:hypothetical protein
MQIKTNPNISPSFSVTRGRGNVYERIVNVFTESTALIYIACTADDMARMYNTIVPERIKLYKKTGGRVRLLIDTCDNDMVPFANQFGADEVVIIKMPFKGRIFAQENTQAVISTSMTGVTRTDDDDSVIHTTYHDIVSSMFSLCDHLWNAAKCDTKIILERPVKN